jgi:hypothetical protein
LFLQLVFYLVWSTYPAGMTDNKCGNNQSSSASSVANHYTRFVSACTILTMVLFPVLVMGNFMTKSIFILSPRALRVSRADDNPPVT